MCFCCGEPALCFIDFPNNFHLEASIHKRLYCALLGPQTNLLLSSVLDDCSRPTRAGTSISASGSSWPVCAHQRRRGVSSSSCRPQRPLVPVQLHLSVTSRRTLPHVQIRPVYAAEQYHGHRQHLRVGSKTAVLGRGMGAKHSLLSRPSGHGSGGAVEARVERTVCAERFPVLYASARCPASSGGRTSCVPHGGGQGGSVHGSHQDIPGTGREVESSSRRLGGVQLSQGHRSLHDR